MTSPPASPAGAPDRGRTRASWKICTAWVGWRPERDCINNLLSFLTPFFWWGRGFELNARQNRATEESKPPH